MREFILESQSVLYELWSIKLLPFELKAYNKFRECYEVRS